MLPSGGTPGHPPVCSCAAPSGSHVEREDPHAEAQHLALRQRSASWHEERLDLGHDARPCGRQTGALRY